MSSDDHPSNPYIETPDEVLLELLHSEQPQQVSLAFEAIYQRYHLDVWRYIQSRGVAVPDAEDIFSEVWITACRKLPDFVWQGTSIKYWLLTVAKNKHLEFVRRQKDVTLSQDDLEALLERYLCPGPDADDTPPSNPPPVDAQQAVDQLLAKIGASLSQRDRKILLYRYYKEKSCTDIALTFDMTPAAVRQVISRALKKLRDIGPESVR